MPELVNAVIEIPKGSKNKYELDEASGLLRLDRVLSSSVHYPANYGFIPRTRGEDGDPLDVIVIGQEPILPLTLVSAKPLGVIWLEEADGARDSKIVAVLADDPQFGPCESVSDLPAHVVPEIENFFQDYKVLEGEPVKVKGLGGVPEAHQEIECAAAAYRDKPCGRRHGVAVGPTMRRLAASPPARRSRRPRARRTA